MDTNSIDYSPTGQFAAVVSAGLDLVRTLVADGMIEGGDETPYVISVEYHHGPGYEHETPIGMDLTDLATAATMAGVGADFEEKFGHLLAEPVAA